MKRYELKFNKGGRGVFKVSVVKDPAIESTLVHFSSEKKEEIHYFTDEDKRLIYSVVMRPNMDIFRRDINGEPANVFYTTETVAEAQINYFRNNGNSATNINHSELADAEGIFPFESWIVTDAKTDRAVKFGLDVRDGDWVMGLKVDNDELWNEHIKTGKLDGFSVEATNINYELKEAVNMSKDKQKPAEPKEKTLLEQLDAFFENFKKQFKAAEEAPEETEEEKAARLAAEAAASEAAAEGAADDAAADDAAADDAAADNEDDAKPTEKEAALETEVTALKAQIATLKAEKVQTETELETMTAEKAKVSADLLKMSKATPAAKPVKNLPAPEAQKNYKDMNNAEKMRFNRENKKF